jgi:hypothetical protein
MCAIDLLSRHLHYKDRALAVHRKFTRVRGCGFLREDRSAPPYCVLTEWEQAIVNGRSSAVVLHLLDCERAALEDCIEGQWSSGRILAAERKKREEVQAFDEVNRLILKWVDCVPDWTPALAAFQQENLQLPDGRSQLPARRPRVPVRPTPAPPDPDPQVP